MPVDPGVVLLLQVPRTNDKKELAAEQMFASLHGLLTRPAKGLLGVGKNEHISLEITVRDKRIGFYIWSPAYLKDFVEEQIYAQYPTVQITEVAPELEGEGRQFSDELVTELTFTGSTALPIKTFQSFEVDPLAGITAALAKFEDDEEATIQLLIRPAAAHWHRKSERYSEQLRTGVNASVGGVVSMLWQSPAEQGQGHRLTDDKQTKITGAEDKAKKLGYELQARVLYRGNSGSHRADLQVRSIVASFKQFNSTYLNGFQARKVDRNQQLIHEVMHRAFNRAKPMVCNIEEVATLYHLPHTNVETPFILWAKSMMAEPPATLPIATPETALSVSPVATTNFRGHATPFGLLRSDRSRHLYIIGQTGTGKSGFLELLTNADIMTGQGFAVIDPHGDYALSILKRIPAERMADVVYFNPGDIDFPMGFNPLEVTDSRLKTHTCSELVTVLKRMFDYSWGPRLEYILRYCVLALLDYPDATMLDITRLLTEKQFRAKVLEHVTDPVVRGFWTVEFTSWNEKFQTEAVAPILNKVGAFTANPLVRNIIGQPKSSFDLRHIMDEGKIFIVNLSRGIVGEDNAALLGALLVTKIQMAAMSRANVGLEERKPFYLYVDEFQNFATDSFATILSEARKYGLCLTVANQYIAQMLPEIRDAIFGNVGSMVAFRLSADDAKTVVRYFEPKFTDYDLVQNHNRHFTISMTIDGEKVPAFSAITLDLPPYVADASAEIVEYSRSHYARPVSEVETEVWQRYSGKVPAAVPPAPQVVAAPQAGQMPLPKEQPTATTPAVMVEPMNPEQRRLRIGSSAVKHNVDIAKPKRKRARRRKKTTGASQAAPAAKEPAKQPTPKTQATPSVESTPVQSAAADDGTTIYLR